MKILITNRALKTTGGTETWCHTMAKEIKRQGHDVAFATPAAGAFAKWVEKEDGIVTRANLEKGEAFDRILINHGSICMPFVKYLEGRKILTCHSNYHSLEKPVDGADAYVAISEEAVGSRPHDPTWSVIRNPIDLERFKPVARAPGRVRVLTVSRNEQAALLALSACIRLDYAHVWIGGTGQRLDHPAAGIGPVLDPEAYIQDADIVIGYGRSIYEALACGKAALVFDTRRDESLADGWASEQNIGELRSRNCAGRTNRLQWTVDDLEEALKEWPPTDWARPYAEANHDVEQIVNQYLEI